MRFVVIHTISAKSWQVTVPPGRNPVRIGQHPANDVVLPSPYVGPCAGAIGNEGAGEGWQFWNLSGREIRVDGMTLTHVNQKTPLASGQTIVCFPFNLTVEFDPEDIHPGGDGPSGLDYRCAEMVRDLHRQLSDLYSSTTLDRAQQLTDDYLLNLEQKIEDLASRWPDFPSDDMEQTTLGNHIAGVGLRSELLHALSARSGVEAGTLQKNKEAEGWSRMRTALLDQDRDVEKLVEKTRTALGLGAVDDLTEQMKRIEEGFWPFWEELLSGAAAPPARLRRYLAVRRIKEEIKAIWYGFGPLEDLLADPTINEIMVVDPDHIFIEKGGQIESSGRRFLTDAQKIIRDIVNGSGREINTSEPLADARLPDGSRINAVIPPLALKGPCLTIRRFPKRRLTMDELIRRGSLTPSARDFLRAAVINRRNILISGGTGTGKTTMLNCLSSFIPDKERIVTIEDTAELQLHKEHVVTLQARQANAEGKGQVSIRDLVKNSLRMRPDRIVVGECRGGEAIDMLQAMNTGHDGSMTTIHANSPADVVLRLEVLVQQNADTRLPVESIHRQIVSAVDLIVQLRVVGSGAGKKRAVVEIAEVVDVEEDGGVRIVSLFARDETGTAAMRPTGHLPSFISDLVCSGLIADPVQIVSDLGEWPA
ncbi:MAG TPA: ATPase, T2SS/T4P/T4SS family [Gemmataceae bacterium]|nr:ATPase, T2SS/T4P/T4SS family [Gemmataceae bacterium]